MNPLVSICCLTYNHEKYIRDAIESFLMQKTTFPIEILIHDDASTDTTAEIIRDYERKYPHLIFPIYQQENQWSKGNRPGIINRERAKGKYLAYCEGDDYWTDPYKLQKQVDFLEANPEYGLVHSELDHYYVKTDERVKNHWKLSNVTAQEGDLYPSLMMGQNSMIYFCTACFRSDFVVNNVEFEMVLNQNFSAGDTTLSLFISAKSKIGYINESMAVRRVLLFSATQGQTFEYNLKLLLDGIREIEWFSANIRALTDGEIHSTLMTNYMRVINLCYRQNEGNGVFDNYYKKLDKESKIFNVKIMRWGMKNNIYYLISKVLLKILKEIKVKFMF